MTPYSQIKLKPAKPTTTAQKRTQETNNTQNCPKKYKVITKCPFIETTLSQL